MRPHPKEKGSGSWLPGLVAYSAVCSMPLILRSERSRPRYACARVTALVAALTGRIWVVLLGHQPRHSRQQSLQAGPGLGADRKHLVHRSELGGGSQRLRGLRGLEPVALVDGAEHRQVAPRREQG